MMLTPVPLTMIAMGSKNLVGVSTLLVAGFAAFVGFRFHASGEILVYIRILLAVTNAFFLGLLWFKFVEKLMDALADHEEDAEREKSNYVPPPLQPPSNVSEPASQPLTKQATKTSSYTKETPYTVPAGAYTEPAAAELPSYAQVETPPSTKPPAKTYLGPSPSTEPTGYNFGSGFGAPPASGAPAAGAYGAPPGSYGAPPGGYGAPPGPPASAPGPPTSSAADGYMLPNMSGAGTTPPTRFESPAAGAYDMSALFRAESASTGGSSPLGTDSDGRIVLDITNLRG